MRSLEGLAHEIAADLGRSALDDRLRLVERAEAAGFEASEAEIDRLESFIEEELEEAGY